MAGRRAAQTEDMPPIMRDRHITVSRQNHLVRDVTQVAAASKLGDHEILDARSPGRFRGEEPEPRPGLRSGHIPGSKNVHYRTLLNDDGTMKDPDALRAVFEAAGVDLDKTRDHHLRFGRHGGDHRPGAGTHRPRPAFAL